MLFCKKFICIQAACDPRKKFFFKLLLKVQDCPKVLLSNFLNLSATPRMSSATRLQLGSMTHESWTIFSPQIFQKPFQWVVKKMNSCGSSETIKISQRLLSNQVQGKFIQEEKILDLMILVPAHERTSLHKHKLFAATV